MTAKPVGAPDNYEDLIQAIHDGFENLSPGYQKIAVFITQNPNDTAMLSVQAIATRCGVHASGLVRFAQVFGYDGFRELKAVFRARLATAAPGFEARIKALSADLEARPGDRSAVAVLHDLVVRDIASLEDLLADTSQRDTERAVTLLERANTVFIVGQLRSEPVVVLLRYILTMLGRRTVVLDASGGLATHMAKVMTPRDVLFAVSFRFYATEVVNITEAAAAAKVPIIALSDSTLSPLAKSASVLFAVPEHEYTFSRSLAAPMCLAQALMVALAARLQDDGAAPRIPIATQQKPGPRATSAPRASVAKPRRRPTPTGRS